MDGLAWSLAAKAVDAILEDGTEKHTGWEASLAIEYAAPQVEEIENLTEDEGAEALEAVEAAILERLDRVYEAIEVYSPGPKP